MADRLYLDSSSFLTLLLQQDRHATIEAAVSEWERRGASVVSSRLLWLEAQRVTVREAVVSDNDIRAEVREHLKGIARLPLTEDVWTRAAGIDQHLKTLDSIHLATCELDGATLLTAGLDSAIRKVAEARGLPTI